MLEVQGLQKYYLKGYKILAEVPNIAWEKKIR